MLWAFFTKLFFLEETISAIIDKTDIDSKIGLIFSTHIDIGGTKAVA
jgi:hypothetical protein